MSTDPSDLSIEELERLLAERRARKRFATRLESTQGVSSQVCRSWKLPGSSCIPSST